MSVTEAGDDVVLGSCVTSTLVAAGGGGVTVLLIWKVLPDGGGVWSLAKTINGMLAGYCLRQLWIPFTSQTAFDIF